MSSSCFFVISAILRVLAKQGRFEDNHVHGAQNGPQSRLRLILERNVLQDAQCELQTAECYNRLMVDQKSSSSLELFKPCIILCLLKAGGLRADGLRAGGCDGHIGQRSCFSLQAQRAGITEALLVIGVLLRNAQCTLYLLPAPAKATKPECP